MPNKVTFHPLNYGAAAATLIKVKSVYNKVVMRYREKPPPNEKLWS